MLCHILLVFLAKENVKQEKKFFRSILQINLVWFSSQSKSIFFCSSDGLSIPGLCLSISFSYLCFLLSGLCPGRVGTMEAAQPQS